MSDCNLVKIPLEPNAPSALCKFDLEIDEPADQTLYHQILSSIMYLAFYTHPDLIYSVSKLGQFNSNPAITHLRAAKHILCYIKGTLDYAIIYDASTNNSKPIGYAIFIALPFGFNFLNVRKYGEVEYWITMIKILTLLGLMLLGVIVLPLGVTLSGPLLGTRGTDPESCLASNGTCLDSPGFNCTYI